jgi:hypothetical protein
MLFLVVYLESGPHHVQGPQKAKSTSSFRMFFSLSIREASNFFTVINGFLSTLVQGVVNFQSLLDFKQTLRTVQSILGQP